MRYASLNGGKRLRAFLVLEIAGLFDVPRAQAARVAASVEMLHAYSLVHDDLPAMDDDDLRRGQPSTHRAFDEATAILAGRRPAGVGLRSAGAGPATTHRYAEPVLARCELVAAGWGRPAARAGWPAGQMIDMAAETPDAERGRPSRRCASRR